MSYAPPPTHPEALKLEVARSGHTAPLAVPSVKWYSLGSRLVVRDPEDGRYWARTSDPQLVELVLSQLS